METAVATSRRFLRTPLTRRNFVKAATAAGVALYLPGGSIADDLEALAEEEPRIFSLGEIAQLSHGYIVAGNGGTIWTRDISGMGLPGWHPKGPEIVGRLNLDMAANGAKVRPEGISMGPEREIKGFCSVWNLEEPLPLVIPAHGIAASRVSQHEIRRLS